MHVHNFTVSISNDTPGFVYRTGSLTRSAGNQIAEVRTGHSVPLVKARVAPRLLACCGGLSCRLYASIRGATRALTKG